MAERSEEIGSGTGARDSGERGTGEKVRDAAREAQDRASDVAAQAKEKGSELASEGREKAEELAHRGGEMARSRAEEEKGRLVGGIRTVADALRRGSDDLPEDRRAYGRFVETVADRAEGLSRYLEDRDVDEMARDARRFARDHTGVVLTGAFALGLLGARFLKSSGDEAMSGRWSSQDYPGERTYESTYRTSRGYPQSGGYERVPEGNRPGAYSQGEVYHAGSRGTEAMGREGTEPIGRERPESPDRMGGGNA